MVEFCPKCHHPLDSSDDDGRLCEVCNWFGDTSEICKSPPTPTNLELAFTQLLALYRDVCRLELLAEQLTKSTSDHDVALIKIRARSSHAKHGILYLVRETLAKIK